MNEPRVYRYSFFHIASLLLLSLLLGYGVFALISVGDMVLFIILLILVLTMFVYGIYSLSSATIVSDTEIASQRFWMTSSLPWNDIEQVSGGNSGLKLKNRDGDVTVSLNPQIPGYEEVVTTLGEKRPDLFSSPEFKMLERGISSLALQGAFFLIMLGIGVYIFLQASTPWFMAAFFVIIAFAVAAMFIGSPQSITLEGSTLLVKYIFKENTYSADDVESVQLNYQRTRNGRIYFAQIQFKDKKTLRISSMSVGASVTYLVLREWHERQKTAKLSV